MARIKISELNAKTTAEDTDLLPIVDTISGETKKITVADLLKRQYSVNEVFTGKYWIDNKPIYRAIISNIIKNPNASSITIPLWGKIDNIISVDCFGKEGTTSNIRFTTVYAYTSANSLPYYMIHNNDTYNLGYISLQFGTSPAYDNYTYNIIIEYTKTTD